MSNRTKAILFLILLLALTLRLWAIDFGLPYQYHQDEGHEVYRALRLGNGDFDFNRNFKGGYFYLLFIEYAIYYLALRITNCISGLEDFATKFILDPTSFWLIGRLTTAIMGTLSVYALYRLGKKAYNEKVGLWAALFLAVAVVHVEYSHYITVDVLMTLFVILATSSLVDVSRGESRQASLLAGLYIGVAMFVKAPAVLLIIPFFVAHYQAARLDHVKTVAMKNAGSGFALLMLIYLIGNPGLWLGKEESLFGVLRFIFGDTTSETGAVDPVFLVHYSGGRSSLWRYYLASLENSFGVGLFMLVLAGVLFTAWRRDPMEMMMLGFVIPYFVVISAAKTLTGLHYLMPLLPPLALLAARFAIVQIEKYERHRFAVILFLLMTAQPFYRCVAFNIRMMRPDTRTLAKEWLEAHVPAGTKIVIDKGRYRSHWAPPLEESREALQRMLDATDDSGKREFFKLKMQHLSGVTYNLISTVWGTEIESVASYIADGVEYFVISEDVQNLFHRPTAKHLFPAAVAFYNELDERADIALVKIFDPAITHGAGPRIKIYRVIRAQSVALYTGASR